MIQFQDILFRNRGTGSRPISVSEVFQPVGAVCQAPGRYCFDSFLPPVLIFNHKSDEFFFACDPDGFTFLGIIVKGLESFYRQKGVKVIKYT